MLKGVKKNIYKFLLLVLIYKFLVLLFHKLAANFFINLAGLFCRLN